jgi:methylmalonyl-CoA/ethylmalonyl-CoA epimerase
MMTFHHVGIACRDIAEEIRNISAVHEGVTSSPVIFDPEQNAEVVLLTLSDGSNLELISGKQVEGLLKMNITYYHLCFEVDDIRAEIDRLEKENAKLVSAPKPAPLFDNREVAFLYVSYGIIELLSRKK